jgi:hypothetical protein
MITTPKDRIKNGQYGLAQLLAQWSINMNKTLTNNELISTAEINRQLRSKGYKKPYNQSNLSVDFLTKKGFIPAIKLQEGSYWNREILNQIFLELEKSEKSNNVKIQKNEIDYINYLNGLSLRINRIEEMLNKILFELNIK